MKLYLVGGRYVGTQAEAKAGTTQKRGGWSQVDVPTDKEGLIAHLNALIEADGALDEIVHDDAPAPATPPPAAPKRPDPIAIARDLDIEEAIAEADYPRALSLAQHVHWRLMEHAKAAGPAS